MGACPRCTGGERADEAAAAGGVVPVDFPDAAGRGGDGGGRLHRLRRGGVGGACGWGARREGVPGQAGGLTPGRDLRRGQGGGPSPRMERPVGPAGR